MDTQLAIIRTRNHHVYYSISTQYSTNRRRRCTSLHSNNTRDDRLLRKKKEGGNNCYWLLPLIPIIICHRVHCMPELIRIGALFGKSDVDQEEIFVKTIQMMNDRSASSNWNQMQNFLLNTSNHQHSTKRELFVGKQAANILDRPLIEPLIERLLDSDSSFEADDRVCKLLLSGGVVAIFGPINGKSIQHVQSICDTLEIPHLEMRADFASRRQDLTINLYPPAQLLTAAYIELFNAWNWTSFAIVYENSDSMIRLQSLFRESSGTWTSKWSIRLFQYSPAAAAAATVPTTQGKTDNNNRAAQRRAQSEPDDQTVLSDEDTPNQVYQQPVAGQGASQNKSVSFRDLFWKLKLSGETNILLDVRDENLFVALKHAQQVGCMTEKYSYLITSLDLHMIDLEDFKYSKTLITSFRLVRNMVADDSQPKLGAGKGPEQRQQSYDLAYLKSLGLQQAETFQVGQGQRPDKYYEAEHAYDDVVTKKNRLDGVNDADTDNNPARRALDLYLLAQQQQQQHHHHTNNNLIMKMSTTSALIHDALLLLMLGLTDLDTGQSIDVQQPISCLKDNVEPWSYGSSIVNYMRRITFTGLSGQVSFDERGLRSAFTLDLMSVAPSIGLVKIGEWHSDAYARSVRAGGYAPLVMKPPLVNSGGGGQQVEQRPTTVISGGGGGPSKSPTGPAAPATEPFVARFDRIKSSSGALVVSEQLFQRIYSDSSDDMETLIVTTRRTQPYFMLKETPNKQEGNNQYEGFAVDLIHELSKLVGFKYRFKEVDDGKYGAKIKHKNGTQSWNGMIGEIISGKADLAIVDLTITSQREEAVDFTLPFMNTGISILFKKPTTKQNTLFSFLSPFSSDVWAYVVAAYASISALLFFVGRISPYEWANPHPCRQDLYDSNEIVMRNNFSLMNSFWFTTGSLMQQGSDLTPRSMSTRTIAGIWYFFTLIMISSYTANLAAFLTVEKVVYPIENAKDLSVQQEIRYGCVESGSTCTFFSDSHIDTYKRIGQTMEKYKTYVKSNDEGRERVEEGKFAFFMESTSIEYITERDCNLTQIGGLLDSKGYGVATSKKPTKKRPYRTLLSEGILHLQENGVLHILKNRWWKERRGGGTCTDDAKGGGVTELSLGNVGGVFVVLLGGLGLSFLFAIAEFMWKSRKSGTTNRDSMCEEMIKDLNFALSCQSSTKPAIKKRCLSSITRLQQQQATASNKQQQQQQTTTANRNNCNGATTHHRKQTINNNRDNNNNNNNNNDDDDSARLNGRNYHDILRAFQQQYSTFESDSELAIDSCQVATR